MQISSFFVEEKYFLLYIYNFVKHFKKLIKIFNGKLREHSTIMQFDVRGTFGKIPKHFINFTSTLVTAIHSRHRSKSESALRFQAGSGSAKNE